MSEGKSSARAKAGKAAWAALPEAEKKRRLAILKKAREDRAAGKGPKKSKKAKKSGTRKASGKPKAAKKTKKARKPGRPKGSADKAPRKTRSDAGKKRTKRGGRKSARSASRKPASRKGGTKRRKSVAPNVRPHKGTAACESCGRIHSKRQHWSHTAGGHSGPTRHSYKCTRNNDCSPSAKKRKAPSKRKATRKYSPPKDVFYKKNARGEWVPIKGRAIPDPMTREMDFRGGTKRPYYKAKPPPKRAAAPKAEKKKGKLQTLEQVKAAAIREKYSKKGRKK